MRRRLHSVSPHPAQKCAVANPGRAKDNVFSVGQIVCQENAVQIFFVTVANQFLSFFVIPWPHFALHLATETFDPGSSQDRFGRPADSHVKIDIAFW
jgi:hypothetical protein